MTRHDTKRKALIGFATGLMLVATAVVAPARTFATPGNGNGNGGNPHVTPTVTSTPTVTPTDGPTATPTIAGQGNCSTGYVAKLDGIGEHDPVTYTGTTIITSVIVKAGSAQSTDGQCTTFTTDGTDGCYTVTGLGTTTATVTKTGVSSPTCKDISHVEFYADGVTPTVTPTNTPAPTAAPTSTPSDSGSSNNDNNNSNTDSGSVESASAQGQVLGASTMGKTGSTFENLSLLVMAAGILMTGASTVLYAKACRQDAIA